MTGKMQKKIRSKCQQKLSIKSNAKLCGREMVPEIVDGLVTHTLKFTCFLFRFSFFFFCFIALATEKNKQQQKERLIGAVHVGRVFIVMMHF